MKSTILYLKHLLFLLIVIASSEGFAQQSNDLAVTRFLSPSTEINKYDSSDQVPISVVLENIGPNVVPSNDLIRFKYNVSYSYNDTTRGSFDTTEVYNIILPAGRQLNIGDEEEYILNSNYTLPVGAVFSIAAEPLGSSTYPENNYKQRLGIVRFTVSLEEEQSSLINKVFYSSGIIKVELLASKKGQLEVFDMTGKQLINQTHSANSKQAIPFQNYPNGIYFLKVTNEQGQTSISKFAKN
jgi:hypothetical protein